MIIIRAARLQDISATRSFINALERSDFDKKTFRTIYTKNLANPDIMYCVAWYNEAPVGFISCHIQDLLHHNSAVGEIQEMFVTEDYRGQGIGKLMLAFIKSELAKRNVHQLEVVSNQKRKRTHRFYLNQKFTWTSKKFVLKF